MLRCGSELGYLGQFRRALRRNFGARPDIRPVHVRGNRRNENSLRKKSRLQIWLCPRNKVRKLLDRHSECDAVFSLAQFAEDSDDFLCPAVNHNAAASASVYATFLVAKGKQTFAGLAYELGSPANQPALRIPVERVGVDVRFGAVSQIVRGEADAMEVLERTLHLVNCKIMSRSVFQRSAAPVYLSRTSVVRAGIEIAVRGEHSLDADVLAHDLSDVVVSAHEAALFVQAKSRAELNGKRGKVLDVGLEIRDWKDHLLGNKFLSAHRKGYGEPEE